MISVSRAKRVLAIIPVNRDCLTFMFKDGTNTTLTYRELRDSWNEMNGFTEESAAPKQTENNSASRSAVTGTVVVPVREPVAYSQFPKLHPLARPRTKTYES